MPRKESPEPSDKLNNQNQGLAVIGELPPDLMAAFNAAVYFAVVVSSIHRLSSPMETKLLGDFLKSLNSALPERKREILAVVRELNEAALAIWQRPVQIGLIKAANAHLAALALAGQVLTRTKSIANPEAWTQCLTEETARFPIDSIVENIEEVAKHLSIPGLPDAQDLIPKIQLEATEAARRRGQEQKRDFEQKQKGCMSLADANAEAMKLAKANPQFVHKTLREWAEAIGCAAGQVPRLPLWRAVAKRTGRDRQGRGKAPRVVSLTDKILAATSDPQAKLDRLISEQEADHEASPLEEDRPNKRAKVRHRKKL